MPESPPPRTPQIYPRLAYRDVLAAARWLGEAFGFRERTDARFTSGAGVVELTELELGRGLVMLGRSGNHEIESPATLGGRSQMVIAYVDDVDAHHARARRAGAEIVVPLAEQPWGDRRYEALDLEGHRWYFGQHVRDPVAR